MYGFILIAKKTSHPSEYTIWPSSGTCSRVGTPSWWGVCYRFPVYQHCNRKCSHQEELPQAHVWATPPKECHRHHLRRLLYTSNISGGIKHNTNPRFCVNARAPRRNYCCHLYFILDSNSSAEKSRQGTTMFLLTPREPLLELTRCLYRPIPAIIAMSFGTCTFH